MPYVVATKRSKGRYVVEGCPSCGRTHRHKQAGTIAAPCGAQYVIVPPPRGRR